MTVRPFALRHPTGSFTWGRPHARFQLDLCRLPPARLSSSDRGPRCRALTRRSGGVILQGFRWLGLDWDEGPIAGAPLDHKGEYDLFSEPPQEHYHGRVRGPCSRAGLAYEHEGTGNVSEPPSPYIRRLVWETYNRELTTASTGPDFISCVRYGHRYFLLVCVADSGDGDTP